MSDIAFIALSFTLGILSAALYAAFKVLRLNFSPSPLKTFVLDLFFVLLTFCALFFMVLYAKNGVFRLYIFASVFIGFLLFRYIFNRFFYNKIEKLILRLNKIIKSAKAKIVDKISADKKSAGKNEPVKK